MHILVLNFLYGKNKLPANCYKFEAKICILFKILKILFPQTTSNFNHNFI